MGTNLNYDYVIERRIYKEILFVHHFTATTCLSENTVLLFVAIRWHTSISWKTQKRSI